MKKKVIIISSSILLIDLISKYLIFRNISLGEEKKIISGFFSVLPIKNTGAAFSIFENDQLFLILISILILGYLIYLVIKLKSNVLNMLSYAFLIGGLFGNLFDRVFYNYVRDFLSFNIFNYSFPVFNIADVFIVVGAALLIIDIVVGGKHEKN